MPGRQVLTKEEGVGVNCLALRRAGRGLLMQAALGAKRGAKRGQQSGHLGDAVPGGQHSPDPRQFPLAPQVAGAGGTEGQLYRPVGGVGRGQGGRRKVRLCPAILLHPVFHLIRVPEMLGSIPRPSGSQPTLSLPVSFSSVIVAQTIPVPNAGHLGLQGTQLASSRCCWGGGRCGCGRRLRN